MLAYYVEWHLREAWRELMLADTQQQAKATRDPVAPAERSSSAQDKATTHLLVDGSPAHSFSTMMAELATIVRNTCRTPNAAPDAPTFEVTTTAGTKQQREMALDRAITPQTESQIPIQANCLNRTGNSPFARRNFRLEQALE